MPPSPAFPTFPLDCVGGPGIHVERQGTATVISTSETILRTGGVGAHFTVASERGDIRLRDGLSLLLRLDRLGAANPTLSVDGSPRAPILDTAGVPLASGALRADFLQRVIYDAARGVWIAERLGGLSTAIFDAVVRLWYAGLPTSPDGIGPLAPWRNGGMVAWTGEDNPSFPIDSPEGRRLTLRLIRDALPTSPDGLAPGEPWLNGDTIAFIPSSLT